MKTLKPDVWNSDFSGGLKEFLRKTCNNSFEERIQNFYNYIQNINPSEEKIYFRQVDSSIDRTVTVRNEATGELKEVLMFGSNNYLGLANHPKVKERVIRTLKKYGVGIAGPPILNGYHKLMKDLEARLSALKKKEDTLIFPSGFSTNLGLIGTLCSRNDIMVYDEYSHASFYDGLKSFKGKKVVFKHNRMDELARILSTLKREPNQALFIGFEGVYSMDGDLAPLPELVRLAKKHNALLMMDDAHGTGVMGNHGGGCGEHFDCEAEVDIVMGTFSKSFSVTGGFVSSSKEIINYLRFNAKPYVFSAALPPITLAAVLAGLEVIEEEPWLRTQLLENVAYAKKKLSAYEFCAEPEAAIIAVKKPEWMDIRQVNRQLLEKGVFVNTVEYPAVSRQEERFRISLSAVHTRADIDYLATCMEEVMAINEQPIIAAL